MFDAGPVGKPGEIPGPRPRVAPAAAPTAEYGGYLAQVCTGCHGKDLASQRVPGTPPELPVALNLTQHANGLDRSRFHPGNPRRPATRRQPAARFHALAVYSGMTEDELRAIWLHLSRLPPVPGQAKG